MLTLPAALGASHCTTEPERSLTPRLTARPVTPSVTPAKGFTPLRLGGDRDGFLYVPDNYDPATPAPLIVILHGAGGSAEVAWTAYAPIADPHDIIVLAPNSRGRTWDMIHGFYGPDLRFIDRALEYTFERCNVDPKRLALGGFSDGASYILSMGLSNGDLFSHLVAYAPGFMNAVQPIVGKPRVYVAHGTHDSILPISASRDHIVPVLREAGYDVTYQEFDGDHEVTWDVAQGTFSWLLDT